MGDLNLSQYQTRVLLACGNVRSNHPSVVAGLHTAAINDAADDLIRQFPDHFPEHQNRTWTLGPTIVGDNRISMPTNLLTIHKLRHSNGATITAGDWSSVAEQVVSPCDVDIIGLLEKDSNVTGYPTLWDRKGTDIYYYPTTRTGYTTTFRVYGMSRETPLSASGDTFRLDRNYDEAIIYLAASKFAKMIGYTERSVELEMAAEKKIAKAVGVVNLEARPMYLRSSFEFGDTL